MKNENVIAVLSKYRKALMGFAALWILMTHEWQIISADGAFINTTERFIKAIGFCGVDIFFLLSGMGLTYAIKKESLLRFYFNRVKRIFIPFVAVAVVCAVVDNWGMDLFLKNISGINFYTVNIYSYLWFVPAILTFYLLFPLYYAIFSKAKNKTLFTLGVLAIWLLVSMILKDTLREDLYGFTNRIPIFIIGVLFGYNCQNKKSETGKGIWLFFLAVLALGLYLAYQTNFNGLYILVPISNCCLPNILISVSLPFLIAKTIDILHKFIGTRWLSFTINKVLCFFGMMSLEFYCVQEWLASKVLGQLVEKYGAAISNLLLLCLVTLSALALFFVNKGFVFVVNKIDKCIFKKKEN